MTEALRELEHKAGAARTELEQLDSQLKRQRTEHRELSLEHAATQVRVRKARDELAREEASRREAAESANAITRDAEARQAEAADAARRVSDANSKLHKLEREITRAERELGTVQGQRDRAVEEAEGKGMVLMHGEIELTLPPPQPLTPSVRSWSGSAKSPPTRSRRARRSLRNCRPKRAAPRSAGHARRQPWTQFASKCQRAATLRPRLGAPASRRAQSWLRWSSERPSSPTICGR